MADRTKYNFNGKKKLPKNRLVLEVIKKYVLDNKNITIEKLKEIFERTKFSQPLDILLDKKGKDSFIDKKNQEEFGKRYFSKNDEVIKIDGQELFVSSEWGSDRVDKGRYFDAFLNFAKNELKYDIKEESVESTHQNPRNIRENTTHKDNKIKNIILYGVPGVGKTYSHKKLIDLIESKKYSDAEIFRELENYKEYNSFDKAKEEKRVKFITFHQSFGYEDFIEGFRPNEKGDIKLVDGVFKSFCKVAKKDKDKNFYLIIDEINRGNISKIFGELITLIEEDKRDVLQVTLPYSKEEFSIPSNLYIIGTMNSTDKSIALIDIALRRRFTFIKMQPNPELVKNKNAKNLMERLNNYIKETLGEEYQIGHSYFMSIKNGEDLTFICEYKIKPLLEEYFYGDDRLLEALEMIQT